MGSSALHQALKTICLNTDWNYAVFWKLDALARIGGNLIHSLMLVGFKSRRDTSDVLSVYQMLTCEDAYCDKNDPSGSKRFGKMTDSLADEQFGQDLLGLAVAKMSYHQYSLGEGIIGQVAVAGKHMWISEDQLPCFEDHDGWKTQFAAGIRTVAVVDVVPHGVIQLGSISNIGEDLKMVNHIREIFLELQNSLIGFAPSNTSSYNDTITSTNYEINNSYTLSDLDPTAKLGIPVSSNVQLLGENIESQSEMDTMNKFPAGYELFEALGPAFYQQNNIHSWQKADEMPGTSSSNLLLPNSGSEHLLEAVVANVCQSDSEYSNSVKWVETHFNDMQTSNSGCYSFESSLGFSSASQSRCSEPLERSKEPVNVTKKRAKPGESSRPRPRDRQLIQDRIKELRELVPNGSKCSIDSLLERTIKHMIFMQSVTKHADKIDKYAESKLLGKDTSVRGSSSHEQGSSWAMEVGNNMKVCPVTVENIGTNGQMLVEMMCEEGIHFLEIADAIRSLGLTILKGVTEPDGDKTWMCFVVEGQNNRNVHRMDILWLLVQILQSKAKT